MGERWGEEGRRWEKRGEEGTWGRWVRDEGHRGEKIVVGAWGRHGRCDRW